MKKAYLLCSVLAVCVSTLALADYGPYPNHQDLNAASDAVYAALDHLARAQNPQDPGNPFGGFRNQAEGALQNGALVEISQSVNFANANPGPGTCAVYGYNGNPDPYPGHAELSQAEALLEHAVVSLRNACNAPKGFGGHRDQAIAAIQQAERDINASVQWANTH